MKIGIDGASRLWRKNKKYILLNTASNVQLFELFFVKLVEFMIHDKIGFRLAMHLRFFSNACKMAFFMIVKVADAYSRRKTRSRTKEQEE